MAISQLSVFVENRQGRLVEVAEVMAAAGVDIRAMSIADTSDFGILRLIVSDFPKAAAALEKNNCIVSVTKVVGVEVPDEPGSLARVIRMASDAGINIEYMYAFITVSGKNACLVLRVADNDAAEKLFSGNGLTLITDEDVCRI